MIAWINLAVLIFASLLFLYFYQLSVSPAALEKLIGPKAYDKCGRYRMVSSLFEYLAVGCYIVYYFNPLPVPLPQTFPWSFWVSGLIALIILVPAAYLMASGIKHGGYETMAPKKNHSLNKGIYLKIRHPQAAGEVMIWWVIAFFLNSPFLVLFSFIYIPIFLMMAWSEEGDLVLRYGNSYIKYYQKTGAFFPKRGS